MEVETIINYLSLSLDMDETQLLSLASVEGRLAVALRNPGDQRVVDNMPDLAANAWTNLARSLTRTANRWCTEGLYGRSVTIRTLDPSSLR